ncbi:hypothetical protein BDP55DRAFT_680011 [Colletotrichum godetiae]|uniref:Uncharacterized protein n=1 Tax=Colletotrichum godetiae TaxID=1209918 RepID=A0AAJ0EN08_9PEZI|nr:uncharacterized protein BDP55DRAFT_680011 [Colletotrichum godetiae]KAK1659280.1 hypothetical protein BDP55DRAFT_680011 [Colletotrichum godetiae]
MTSPVTSVFSTACVFLGLLGYTSKRLYQGHRLDKAATATSAKVEVGINLGRVERRTILSPGRIFHDRRDIATRKLEAVYNWVGKTEQRSWGHHGVSSLVIGMSQLGHFHHRLSIDFITPVHNPNTIFAFAEAWL